jgi:hypothetical protein
VERRKDAFGGSIFMEAGPDLGTSFGEKETDVFNEAAVYNLLKYLIAEKSGGSSVICAYAMFRRTSEEPYLLLVPPRVSSRKNGGSADEFDFPRTLSSETVQRQGGLGQS